MRIKIYVYVFLIVTTSLSCYSQEITKDGIKYTLIAKLKKNYEHDCDCQSRIISNKMFDFRIIDINMEEYYLKDINIIIPCPEGYGDDFFKKGFIYKIEFYDNCTDMSVDQGVCDYDIPKRKRMKRRFWVHSIVKMHNIP
jgi:hypothetical protein